MASPAAAVPQRPTTPQTHPLTPPAEPTAATATSNAATGSGATSSLTTNSRPNQQQQPPTTSSSGSANQVTTSSLSNPNPSQPLTSSSDPGTSRRPRDARLIHLLLSSMGITAYQERVPLQLLDFAYRYTSGVLSDALHLQAEGYDTSGVTTTTGTGGRGKKDKGAAAAAAAAATAANAEDDGGAGGGGGGQGGLSVEAVRTAVSSRMAGQFEGGVPRQWLMERAEERNRVALPVPGGLKGGVGAGGKDEGMRFAGMRLPSERYCLSGVGWGMREEWESEGEVEDDQQAERMDVDSGNGVKDAAAMEDDEDNVDMDDVFGDGDGGGDVGKGDDGGGGDAVDQVMGNA